MKKVEGRREEEGGRERKVKGKADKIGGELEGRMKG